MESASASLLLFFGFILLALGYKTRLPMSLLTLGEAGSGRRAPAIVCGRKRKPIWRLPKAAARSGVKAVRKTPAVAKSQGIGLRVIQERQARIQLDEQIRCRGARLAGRFRVVRRRNRHAPILSCSWPKPGAAALSEAGLELEDAGLSSRFLRRAVAFSGVDRGRGQKA